MKRKWPQPWCAIRIPAIFPTVILILLGSSVAFASPNIATITANQDSPGPTIPPDFEGISVELEDVSADTIFVPSNQSLISLYQLLGPHGVWRIGGSSADDIPPHPLTQQIVNDAAAFAAAVGWQHILIGLNALAGTDLAAQQAGYWLNALAGQDVAFQQANQPEFLYSSGQDWANAFDAFYEAIPGVNWGGPDSSPANIY